ncbi:hypothetical protein DUI87_30268 [Hirundo rustica rustica]|uniref:Uncharacterized protein n=1 Tax=Hirundo rustica rustica TaxID=333673 RepID=A0A3M0J418_HIRRU|nr:hypothetical protein DUI87_30268 [Hirundo rustica rustica]
MKEPAGPRRVSTEVCNCNKYLKVSRERMRQLVEGSRRVSGEHSAGSVQGAQKRQWYVWIYQYQELASLMGTGQHLEEAACAMEIPGQVL